MEPRSLDMEDLKMLIKIALLFSGILNYARSLLIRFKELLVSFRIIISGFSSIMVYGFF